MLLLLVLSVLACGNGQLASTYIVNTFGLNSSTFLPDTVPTTCGEISSFNLGALNQVFSLGNAEFGIGYTMYNLTASTTMTYALVLRDGTKQANTSLTAFRMAVSLSKAVATLTIPVNVGVPSFGAATSTNYVMQPGATDGYGNVFDTGDNIWADTGVIISSSAESQFLMINAYWGTPLMFVW